MTGAQHSKSPTLGGLVIDTADARPIWRQFEEGIARLILFGHLQPGSPLPSVRDLARRHLVNPATIAKAYQSLGRTGLVEVRLGAGTFVAAEPPTLDRKQREAFLGDRITELVELALALGFESSELAALLEARWNELAEPTTPKEDRPS